MKEKLMLLIAGLLRRPPPNSIDAQKRALAQQAIDNRSRLAALLAQTDLIRRKGGA